MIRLAMVVALLAVCGCTVSQRDAARRYAYLYCKVRDADPFIHQTVDAMVPVVGELAGATVSAGCVLIKSYSENRPEVTSIPPGYTVTGTAE